MRKKILYLFSLAATLAMVAWALPGRLPINNNISQSDLNRLDSLFVSPGTESDIPAGLAAINIGQDDYSYMYDNLPVGDITVHDADNAWGTVIYLPQNHRYPGTAVSDDVNDSAELTQQEIHSILSYLYDQTGISFMMAEGELYGPVAQEEIDTLARKIELRDTLKTEINGIQQAASEGQLDANLVAGLSDQADKAIAALDREIYLRGALHMFKAEQGGQVTLYGTENSDTLADCTTIVRNYIYEQDQLAQCNTASGGSTGSGLALNSINGSLAEKVSALKSRLQSLGGNGAVLGQLNNFFYTEDQEPQLGGLMDMNNIGSLLSLFNQDPLQSLSATLGTLETVAQSGSNSDLAAKLSAAADTCQSLIEVHTEEQAPAATTASAPSRQDNPYSNITDTDKLENMISDSEQEIQDKVIDQRNREAADNFARALKEQNQTAGFLEFGAGHEDGLIPELNKQGLTVIEIQSKEVVRRQEVDGGQ